MFIIFVSVTNISAFTSALIPRVALSLPPVFFYYCNVYFYIYSFYYNNYCYMNIISINEIWTINKELSGTVVGVLP